MRHQPSQPQVLLLNNDKTIPDVFKNFINSLNKACEDPDFRRFIEPFWPHNKFPVETETNEIKKYAAPSALSLLLENSNTVLFSIDVKKLKFTNISSECENIYGYTASEFYDNYDLWKRVMHPDDIHIADLLGETLNKGRMIMSQYRVINKDGSIRWIEGKFIPTLNGKGRLIKVDGISIDRTDSFTSEKKLRENEQRLIESEKKYRVIFENNPQPMWVLDNDSLKLLDVNAAATKHYGYSKSEFLSMSAYDLRTPAERDRLVSLEINNRDNINNKGIWELLKKDGTISSAEITAELIDFEGKSARLILAHDVTERINTEKELKLSNERYELVTRATNDAIWDWNLCRNELYWSEGYEKLFGYRNEGQDVNVHSWTSRIHHEDVQRVSNGLMKKINDSDTDFWEDEYRYMKADGSVAFIYDRGFIIYENGIPVRMVGAMQDITNRKKTEEFLYKSEANLRNLLENTDTAYILLDENASV
ncbi:MAG: PAS domain-containing protein, partial [Bacteroidia bacterium]